jgi:hypothetical protein
MDRTSGSGTAATDAPNPPADSAKRHFDTFETQFFKQGDDSEIPPEVDRFDDLDDGRKRFAPSRQFIVGTAVGSVCLAVLGCVALWGGGSRLSSTESAASPSQPALAPNVVAAAPSAAPAAPAVPGSSPSAPAVLAPPSGASANTPSQALHEPGASPGALAAKPPGLATASGPSPSAADPTPPAATSGKVAPSVAATTEVAEKPASQADGELPATETPVTGSAASARARCEQAVSRRHSKDILSLCEAAFTADPSAADIAVLLARTQYDRGRLAQAVAWSKKALAVDPNAADAYVFIGGAEQGAGRNKAAKEAYKNYLRLAPAGRYAADLRAIVSSL